VLHLPVPLPLLDQVLAAAKQEQIPIATDAAERARLAAKSARQTRLHELEELLPHLAPELRAEVKAMLALVRERDGEGLRTSLEEPLGALEAHLLAERSTQTESSLRGPKPVFAAEIRADLAELTRLLDRDG
jgi:hypothetical protein